MLTIQEIQQEAYATATSKGWHDRPMREPGIVGTLDDARDEYIVHHDRVLRSHALMHTELSEAQELLYVPVDETPNLHMYFGENGKPEGFVVEIADVVVRVGDTAGALGIELINAQVIDADTGAHLPTTWLTNASSSQACRDIQAATTDRERQLAVIEWLSGVRHDIDKATEDVRVDAFDTYAVYMVQALRKLAGICAGLGLDLNAAIKAKMTYNKTRPHRHGGKQA